MMRHRTLGVFLSSGGLILAAPEMSPGQVAAPASPQAQAPASVVSSLELALLRSLRANPITAPYPFSTERRGNQVVLKGRVGTKQIHDIAIQTAIGLGVPVSDSLVIDTAAAHQAAAYSVQNGLGAGGYPGGMVSGPAYPGAGSYGSLPYTYPPPLFGRLDDPFFGYEPPAIAYPPWWGALTARRLGPPAYSMPPTGSVINPPSNGVLPGSSATAIPGDPAAGQPINLPNGTIDMAIDGRGVATIRGNVPTLTDRILIGQRLAQTPGVAQVINLLNVQPTATPTAPAVSDRPPPPPTPDNAPAPTRPATALLDGAPIVVDAGPVGDRVARAISSRPSLASLPIRVKVRDGVAALSGKVPTVYEAMQAYRAVQQTPGVREVDDRLEFVVPDGSTPNPLADKGRPEDVEPYLEAQIRRQVGDLAHVDRVRVQGDSLELRGTIARSEDRDRFDAILRSMPVLRGFRLNAEFPAETR